jgi:tryptophan-rich sensory protein
MSLGLGSGWGPIIGAAAWGVVTLGVGGALTEIGPWYRGLKKPRWQPPDLLFGPAWTIIIVCACWSLVLAWNRAPGVPERAMVVTLFMLNGMLNAGWSLFFFKWRRPDWALIEVVPLWLSIGLLILECAAMTTRGAWLLVPYLAWVSFAAFLNFTIVRLNPKFG